MIIETHHSPSVHTPRRGQASLLTWACIGYLACVVGVGLAMRHFGDRHWLGTVLLLSPRWVMGLPLVVLVPWAVVARRWRVAVVLTAALACLLWAVMGFRLSIPRGDDAQHDLRLLSCNIHRKSLDAAVLAAYLREVEPDVVALQDWTDVHMSALFDEGWQVRRAGELLVASRYPIRAVTPIPFEDDPNIPRGEQGAAAVFELETPRGIVNVLNVSIASPHVGLNSMWTDHGAKLATNIARRELEMSAARRAVEGLSGPLLIAGDFNTVSESPIFTSHWADFADAFSTCGVGLGYTYFTHTTQIRIDHILASPEVVIERCRVGPDVRAAHRPLVADVTIP